MVIDTASRDALLSLGVIQMYQYHISYRYCNDIESGACVVILRRLRGMLQNAKVYSKASAVLVGLSRKTRHETITKVVEPCITYTYMLPHILVNRLWTGTS